MNSNDSMRGLFFIIKGRYTDKLLPAYTNTITNEVGYLGGYDPSEDTTDEWYMVLDRVCFHCVGCGSDLDKVLQSARSQILRCKGSARTYFKHVCEVTSEDYWEVNYLGQAPLSTEERAKKAEGRCPRTSPAMKCLYGEVYNLYADYFSEEISEMERSAYTELNERKPVNRSRKILQRVRGTLKSQPPKKSESGGRKIKKNTTQTLIRPERKSVKLLRV